MKNKIIKIAILILILFCLSGISQASEVNNDTDATSIKNIESPEKLEKNIVKESVESTKSSTNNKLNDIYVSTKGNNANKGTKTSPKATIQNAINNVNNNGAVHIAGGTYRESGIKIDKNLSIIGESSKTTIIESQNKQTMTISKKVLLKTLTIKHAKTNDKGGAIYNRGTLTLKGVKIQTSNARYGGAIYNEGTLTATKTAFTGNSAHTGGAIYNTKQLILNKCSFSNNKADNTASAIYTESLMDVDSTNFTKNSNTAIYIKKNNKKQQIKSSIFTLNTGKTGAAIYNKKSIMTIEKTLFKNNKAKISGGSIYSTGTLKSIGNTFNNNSAKNGGALFNTNTLMIYGNSIKNNKATESGGAIYNKAKAIINNTKFNNNQAKNGGVLYSKTDKTITVWINNSVFIKNRAKNGGALFIYNKTKLDVRSSAFNDNYMTAIYLNTASTENVIYNSTLTNNKGTCGGAINNNRGTLLIKSNYISTNHAQKGGAVYNNGNTILKFNIILNNKKYDVYNNRGHLNANNNWWGNNKKVNSNRLYKGVMNSWIYMTMTSTKSIFVNNTVTTKISLNNAYDGKKIETINPELYDIKIKVQIKGGGVQKNININNKRYYTFSTKFTKTGTATITATISQQKIKNSITINSKTINGKITGIFLQKSYSINKNIVNGWVKAGITDVFVQSQASKSDTKLLRKTISLCKGTNIRVHAWVICFLTSRGTFDISTKKQKQIKSFIKNVVKLNGISGVSLDYVRYSGTNPKKTNSNTITKFVKEVNSIVKKQDKKLLLSACVFAEKASTKKYYGQDYAALSPYIDIMMPMTYRYDYSAGRNWLKDTTNYVKKRATSSMVVSIIQTYTESSSGIKKLSKTNLEADAKAVMNGGSHGYVLFRYGLIKTYPKSAHKL